MNIDIRGLSFALTPPIVDHVTQRVETAVAALAASGPVRGVRALLRDVNGPRGGVDKRCRLVAWPEGREPIFAEVGRHPRAMPQYTLGHAERVAGIRQQAARHRGLFLTGIGYDGVGIPDCIRAAQATADATLASLADPAAPAAA